MDVISFITLSSHKDSELPVTFSLVSSVRIRRKRLATKNTLVGNNKVGKSFII